MALTAVRYADAASAPLALKSGVSRSARLSIKPASGRVAPQDRSTEQNQTKNGRGLLRDIFSYCPGMTAIVSNYLRLLNQRKHRLRSRKSKICPKPALRFPGFWPSNDVAPERRRHPPSRPRFCRNLIQTPALQAYNPGAFQDRGPNSSDHQTSRVPRSGWRRNVQ